MEVEEKTEINPADYFSPDTTFPKRGLIRNVWFPTILGGVGFTFAIFLNTWKRKPPFSGLQQHVFGSALGVTIGLWGHKFLDRRSAHKDNIIYNYIITHPEDFPPIQRKKYAEVIERWVPIR